MSIKDLLKNDNCIVVLDTNVLLNIYSYSPEFSDFALECLKKVRNYIYLPSTVRLEYENHYRFEFSKMEKRIARAGKATENQIRTAQRKILDSCDGLDFLHFPDVDVLRSNLAIKLDDLQNEFYNFFQERPTLDLIQYSWHDEDLLELFVKELDSKNRIMTSPVQKDIFTWCDEGEERYKKEIPPGFKDAKKKTGIKKYSDFIIWKEILRFSNENEKNLIFVTEDMKADWWESENGKKQFHSQLITEFSKTGQKLVPMTTQLFYDDIANSYGLEKTDAVEIALQMTDEDYFDKINDSIFDAVETDLIYGGMDYIDVATSHIGSCGINEFSIRDYMFEGAERIERCEGKVVYNFYYDVTLEGVSFDYWGRLDVIDEDFFSDGCKHVFDGEIIVQVEREAGIFLDFKSDESFETAFIIKGKLRETSFSERVEKPEELNYCPGCSKLLNNMNDSGGLCVDCAGKT